MNINKQAQTNAAFIEALQEFQAAVLDGYRLPQEFTPNTWPHISQVNTSFARIGISLEHVDNQKQTPEPGAVVEPAIVDAAKETLKAQLETKASEEPVTESASDSIDDLTKKVDLLNYAERNGIKVPEELVQASAIKKYLKNL